MKKNFLIAAILLFTILSDANAQLSTVNKKGTIIPIDSSKWTISGINIFNKNTGNIGVGNPSPTYKLDVTGKVKISDSLVTNTARILTLSSGSANDSVVMSDPGAGIIKRVSPAVIVREPWRKLGDTATGATKVADSIVIIGNVSIGKITNGAKLDVKGRINADSTVQASNYSTTVQNLSTGTTTWDLNLGATANWTLTASVANTLTISNAKSGMFGLIKITNGGGSSLNFAGGTSNKVMNGGLGVATLTQALGSIDILTFYYDGTSYYWTVGNNYN